MARCASVGRVTGLAACAVASTSLAAVPACVRKVAVERDAAVADEACTTCASLPLSFVEAVVSHLCDSA